MFYTVEILEMFMWVCGACVGAFIGWQIGSTYAQTDTLNIYNAICSVFGGISGFVISVKLLSSESTDANSKLNSGKEE